MTGLDSLRQRARRFPKAIFWLMTPWRMPQRLRFLRERAEREAKAQALELLLEQEQARLEALRGGRSIASISDLDLCSDADALDAVNLPRDQIIWSPVSADAVVDRGSAARFCIDLLRHRKDLYARFPRALSNAGEGDFVAWLKSEEGFRESGLTEASAKHFASLFLEDFSARARQTLFANERIRKILPHGLTPVGRRSLFRWFMQYGRDPAQLQLEEVWWLFLQAAENPQLEVIRAYLFTPQWQQQFPDALTVFGWDKFSDWFVENYGADSHWMDPAIASEYYKPALQVRLAYQARAEWQTEHPSALSDDQGARAFIQWLASGKVQGISKVASQWCRNLDALTLAPQLLEPGANVLGHFCYPSGLRVSVESMTQAMALVGIQTSLRDLRTDAMDDPNHLRFDGPEVYDVTIIHAQPEPFFTQAYARADVSERAPRTYRIAYWYWEFDTIPESWDESARQVDEVWAATEFVARGLRKRLSIPVRTLFPGVQLAPFEVRDRAYFGLEEGRFAFLFTFHMVSVMERKNPLGLIRAFKMAFPDDEQVTLILKTSFGDRHPVQFQELCDAAAGANIVVINQVYSPNDVLSLMEACDVYVSLHRSEGLGLTMAEAMLMGKPVIATNFSGNVDFMDDSNSLLVPYELVKLSEPIPPYDDAALEWAEPSTEHAARLMRRVYDDQGWARELGARAKASAETNLSLYSAGQRIARRLDEIKAMRHTVRPNLQA
ncbi:glycosyltransferase family 4 protein [Variovorax paradoxus]|uniref:glycosyltransferase family 4 protein n=1 Tax=Variovorax paradoxus TaxID=34073 RepID=UPI003D66064E